MKRKDDLIHVRVKSGKYVQDHFDKSEDAITWTGHTVYKTGEELDVTPGELAIHPGKFEVLTVPESAEA